MPALIPQPILATLNRVDSSWRAVLLDGLQAVADADAGYLAALARYSYLPTQGRLLAAFAQPFDAVRYVLVGEGPYPREASATGVCFMDGAVAGLWSENGLSKPVNRATSLRNFIKMLLVAEGALQTDATTGAAIAAIGVQAQAAGSGRVQTLAALQDNLTRHGFLLLNASLVFRPTVAPAHDAQAWLPFLKSVLLALATRSATPPVLVLWGKIAGQVNALAGIDRLPRIVAEHPYNLSFIRNQTMHEFFLPMALLRQDATLQNDGSM